MPIPSRNLGRCFDASVSPEKVALIDLSDWNAPREATYAAFDHECDAVARGLVAQGFARGDAIGIMSLNRLELLYAYFGIMRAGMVAVPISFKLARETGRPYRFRLRPARGLLRPRPRHPATGRAARLRLRRRGLCRTPGSRPLRHRRTRSARTCDDPLHVGIDRHAKRRAPVARFGSAGRWRPRRSFMATVRTTAISSVRRCST